MADNDAAWNDAARDSAKEDAGWSGGRSPSPRNGGNASPRRSSRSPAPRGGGDEYRSRDDGEQNPGNNLHVSGVSKQVTEKDLEEAFAKFGRVLRTQVMLDPHSREPRGFGFVTMEDAEAADAAIAGMNGVDLLGRVLSVQRAKRGRARTPTPGRYYGPPKNDNRFGGRGPPGGRGGYGGYGGPPPDYRYGPPPPRDAYYDYGPPPRDAYDRYGPGPGRDYPPRDYPPPPRGGGGYGPPSRGLSPPPRGGRYDAGPPPPPRGGRYDDAPPPPRRGPGYDDGSHLPPRGRYDDAPPRRY